MGYQGGAQGSHQVRFGRNSDLGLQRTAQRPYHSGIPCYTSGHGRGGPFKVA